ELGRQFWDCLHYNRGGTPAPVPSNKSWISNWGDVPPAGRQGYCADQLSRDEGLFRPGRRDRRTWVPLPAVAASGEPVVLHGLLPGHCVADIGRGPVVVVDPAFQASRKVACGSLKTELGEGQYAFRSRFLPRGICMTDQHSFVS